jgi:E3 ubiquitin-protein ligase TM129
VFICYKNEFSYHPIVNRLNKLAQGENLQSWHLLANKINAEYLSIEKFSCGSLFNRVYVTNNWILKVTLYNLQIIKQENASLKITNSTNINFNHEGDLNVNPQYLTIKIIDASQESLNVHLNALEYKDFKDKVANQIEEPTNIHIKQSIHDQFLDVFKEEITRNKTYECRQDEVDMCIGCMKQFANMKLVKSCDELNRGECRQCNCRPMWCLDCVGKWFAYRQNPNEPYTWLSSRCTCATCRAPFCVLDVKKIVLID